MLSNGNAYMSMTFSPVLSFNEEHNPREKNIAPMQWPEGFILEIAVLIRNIFFFSVETYCLRIQLCCLLENFHSPVN